MWDHTQDEQEPLILRERKQMPNCNAYEKKTKRFGIFLKVLYIFIKVNFLSNKQ